MSDTTGRNVALRQILTDRWRELQDDVQRRIHEGRTAHAPGVRDYLEHSGADIEQGIELALLQMRAETLTRIDQALVRLDEGQYGSCVACDGEITERRLRALPFAVRCQACEEVRERDGHTVRGAQRRGVSLFADA